MLAQLLKVLSFGSKSSLAVYLLVSSSAFFAFLVFRDTSPDTESRPTASAASVLEGKVLAGTFCQSCHLLPDPASLDAKTWEHGVMPAMGPGSASSSTAASTTPTCGK